MTYTPNDIYANVQPMLNDSAGALWTTTILRQQLLIAYGDLITELQAVGIPATYEISAVIPVPLSAVPVTVTYPTDLVVPMELLERTTGSSELFVPMNRCQFLPERTPDTRLLDWAWVDQEIRLVGASQDNDVKIRYLKDLAALPADGNPIPVISAQAYLQYRTAALTAAGRGQNFELADLYNKEATSELEKVISINVKNLQALPVRKQPYKGIRKQWPSQLP